MLLKTLKNFFSVDFRPLALRTYIERLLNKDIKVSAVILAPSSVQNSA